MVSDVEHNVRGSLWPLFTCNTVRNFREHSMASCCCTARGSSETYVTRVHGAGSLAMRRRMWLFERKWFDGSKIVSSKPGLLRQSVYWNKRRVDRSPRSRAESLAWGGLACSILFLRSPGPCCKFKLQIAMEDRRRLFFPPPILRHSWTQENSQTTGRPTCLGSIRIQESSPLPARERW